MRDFQQLSRAEMKNVKGGMHNCAAGQSMYNCSYGGGCSTQTGAVCGSSQLAAANTLINTLTQQGTWSDDCYYAVSCS